MFNSHPNTAPHLAISSTDLHVAHAIQVTLVASAFVIQAVLVAAIFAIAVGFAQKGVNSCLFTPCVRIGIGDGVG